MDRGCPAFSLRTRFPDHTGKAHASAGRPLRLLDTTPVYVATSIYSIDAGQISSLSLRLLGVDIKVFSTHIAHLLRP